MRILIIDDHALFREGLGLLLHQLEPDAELDLVAGAEDAVDRIAETSYDLVLMDWNLNGMSGLEALIAVREASQIVRLVVLSAERDANLIRTCVDHGASGFIHKDSSPTLLISAMRLILGGGIFLPPEAFFQAPNSKGRDTPSENKLSDFLPEITDRQISVLRALVKGLPNKLIAREIGISDDTVKQHLSAIYKLMNVQSRTQAIYMLAKNKVHLD